MQHVADSATSRLPDEAPGKRAGWVRILPFVAVWALGIVIVQAARFAYFAASVPFPVTFSPRVLLPAEGFGAQWIVLWTLLVALLAARAFIRSAARSPATARQADYLLVWLTGAIALVSIGLSLLAIVAPTIFGSPAEFAPRGAPSFEDRSGVGVVVSAPYTIGPASAVDQSLTPIWLLLAVWTAVVLIAFFFVGDGADDGFHRQYVAPYSAVLTTLTLFVLLIFGVSLAAHVSTQSRVQSLNASVALIRQTSSDLAAAAQDVNRSGVRLAGLIQDTTNPPPFVDDVPDWQRERLPEIKVQGEALVQSARSTSFLATSADSQMASAVDLLADDPNRQTTREELEAVEVVVDQAVVATSGLTTLRENLSSSIQELDSADELDGLEATVADVADMGSTVAYRADLASDALAGLESNGTALVLWLGAVYASFVLFPWVLLMMFLYRKRRLRAVEIVADLMRLDPSPNLGLLRRALGIQDISQELTLSATSLEESVNRLLDRAFSNREYVLGATLLTAMTAAGWYYFLYPLADVGMANWVASDAGIQQIGADLAQNASPLTMGFAGAYFFVSQMLLRRYLSGDLYPAAYVQSSVRIIWVFTLSVALAVLFPEGGLISPTQAAMVAFLAGVFPREGFRLISTTVSSLIGKGLGVVLGDPAFPTDTGDISITKLEGVDLWVESRLLEENVETVQGMATAPMEQLVVGTYYPATRIVDWVDQAILYTHSGDDHQWWTPLHSAGIRTATDLLDAAGFRAAPSDLLMIQDFTPKDEDLAPIERAIAEALTASNNTEPKPSIAVLRAMCNAIWPDPNLRYVFAYKVSVADSVLAREAAAAGAPLRVTRPRTVKDGHEAGTAQEALGAT